ncbi:hypothetical protein ACFSQ7_19460 [Paenibacillus rhizoplanae]
MLATDLINRIRGSSVPW